MIFGEAACCQGSYALSRELISASLLRQICAQRANADCLSSAGAPRCRRSGRRRLSPAPVRSPPNRSLLRSSSLASRDLPTHTATASILSSSTPTRSRSHAALTTLKPPVPIVLSSRQSSEPDCDANPASSASSRTNSLRTSFPASPQVGPTRPSAMKRSDTSREPCPAALDPGRCTFRIQDNTPTILGRQV